MDLNKIRYIAVEGPIGVGKTSLTKMLGEYFDASVVMDPEFDSEGDNSILKNFYRDTKRYAFQTEMFFMISRYKQQIELLQHNLFSKVTVADYIFDRSKIFAYINLSDYEIRLYEDIYSILKLKVPKPDFLIYLQADIDTLKKRIRIRGRNFEKYITDDYIDEMSRTFNHYFFHYIQSPILIINTDEIDFVRKKGDFEDLIKKILSHKKGIEYYSPLGSN